MSYKHLTNPHHRRVLRHSEQFFMVGERHSTAKELIDTVATLRWSSPRADMLARELRQCLGQASVVSLANYRATRVNLMCRRLRDELRVLEAAAYIAEVVQSMRENQTLEAILPSGRAGVRIHYKRGGALVAFIPDADTVPTYTDYVRDNYYRAEVGGIAPGTLGRYYSKPFLDVVRLLLANGLQSELALFTE